MPFKVTIERISEREYNTTERVRKCERPMNERESEELRARNGEDNRVVEYEDRVVTRTTVDKEEIYQATVESFNMVDVIKAVHAIK